MFARGHLTRRLRATSLPGVEFYPLGFFENGQGQGVSGTASLIGDIECRGQSVTKSSGTYCGMVEAATTGATNTTDVTVAPPYVWRP